MPQMKVAIVGAGVSGLVAAHLLARSHEVTLYEAGAHAGGHTNTVRVHDRGRELAVDTGFIVFNDRTYPSFTRLLRRLGVAAQRTHMSFSVSATDFDFEYAGTPAGLFAQPRNLLRPSFARMISDLVRFNRELARVPRDETEPLGEFLERLRFSPAFVQRLIVPQVSAVWSADPRQMDSFPVGFLAEFFTNHGMLGFRDRPRWFTVAGGSERYVRALAATLRGRIRLRTPVREVRRELQGVELRTDACAPERYDHVLIAAHSDQALAMLADPSPAEREILGAIPYQRNEAVLHTDSSLLPRRRAARAAWNYHLLGRPQGRSTVTYWMNHLQRLAAHSDYCVTLNRSDAIDPAKVIAAFDYAHPVFTPQGIAAQRRRAEISGMHTRTHYCGAWWGWGFHEDGVRSALAACEPFGEAL